MEYCMLLWPHSNARYQNETVKLAQSELSLIFSAFDFPAEIGIYERLNLPALLIQSEAQIDGKLLNAVSRHSLMYGLFGIGAEGALNPVCARAAAYVGADMPAILKYKGKTNELFLQLLINAALFSGSYARDFDKRLEFLDPMCGRGTSLFEAANYGWNATGTDVDKVGLAEAEKFLKRYFEYHRMKHAAAKKSRTMNGRSVPVTEFTFADTPEHYKSGETGLLTFANADAAGVQSIFGRERFHVIASDLPYGIQHGSTGGSLEQLLKKTLPVWCGALKKGGCVAVSYNAQTMRTDKVRRLMMESGLEPLSGGAYDGFAHWVEQAITRDIAIGRKSV